MSEFILLYFVIIPLVMMGVLYLIPGEKKNAIRYTMAGGSALLVALAAYITIGFFEQRAAGMTQPYLFTASKVWYEGFLNIHLSLGVDGISVAMLVLSSVITFTGSFASFAIEDKAKEYFLWFLMLSIGVFGFFISIDLFTMFLFYEVALIPMYLLIGLWGSGPKEYAAMKLTLMLMGGSAFLMVGIFGIYFMSVPEGGVPTFEMVELMKNVSTYMPIEWQHVFFCLTFVGFGVLGAMFPFHTWSPDGHASAPTAVSMLHAGVLMKLGGYGCFRVAMCLMPQASADLGWIFLILTGTSVFYGAYSACVQNDLKYINAYSSVSHCGMVLFALLMMNNTAFTGAFLQMLSHGLMTALFFSLIGSIYGRTHTRDIRLMGGMMNIMPVLCVCYVIAGMASLGLPGLSGFVAEMNIFVGSFQRSVLAFEEGNWMFLIFTILACTSIVITAVYILRVVGKMLFGPIQDQHHATLTDANYYEKVAAFGLIICVAAIGMFPSVWTDLLNISLPNLVSLFADKTIVAPF
ncbi:MAG: NADH-quinone oxidoreductase subunit M [Paludibacteraceae bacterium]|nr:NADH-quinone oxidoreductase subunit M [Paludibacteraceae bacterium]MBR6041709.1 NADH-quinone oxidoreductase subunit M [Paludibacteraceae bacterium]